MINATHVGEIVLKAGDPVVMTRIPVGGYYASENGSDNPTQITGFGSWRNISPANTVNELKNLSGEDDFVTIGSLYVWKRIS